MLRISTLDGHKRMSTKDLLRTIAAAVASGETDFHIKASGQHDIGGPLWSPQGKALSFTVENPGQRLGAMCLPNTRVLVDGPVPADAGWLNSGGEVIIKGDAGDTAGHCAAGGKIYIGGRAGARSGSLMKHDPLREAPELWILENTGSFSFEFMGGGRAVVCGHECLALPSVLGERPCVGMVGGVVYFRGQCPELPEDVELLELDGEDQAFLASGLPRFLEAIGKPGLKKELSLWKHWHKLAPAAARGKARMPMAEFRLNHWIPGGIFGDVLADDMTVIPLAASGENRLAIPHWLDPGGKCLDCRACIGYCPRSAVKRRADKNSGRPMYSANAGRCMGCGICAAVCPQKIWSLRRSACQ